MPRCAWADGGADPLLVEYHDREWGRPVHGDRAIFERLSLEAFQAGLSWLTILRKRDAFRAAFAGFEPRVVAAFDERSVDALLADAGIVRNRRKIEAVIANARVLVRLQAEHGAGALDALVWSHAPATPRDRPSTAAQVPAVTAESRALSARLKAVGFRFVGPTTAYAAMQACGLVDDHVAGCPAAR